MDQRRRVTGRPRSLLRDQGPTLVLLTLLSYVWLAGTCVDAGTSALSALRGQGTATSTERLIVTITVVAISLTPLVFWLRRLGRIWRNSVHSVEVARTFRRLLLAATVPYAFAVLGLRVLSPLADPAWAAYLPAVSLASALCTYLVLRTAALRRRSA